MKRRGRPPVSKHLRPLVGHRVRALRTRENLTQPVFASMLSVSAQTVRAWEAGRRLPDVDRIIDMADAFGVTTDWILGV